MDRLRSIEAETDYPVADEPHMDAPPAIGTDERRMHVRAYNYWVSLLNDRAYPSIEDLDPASIEDFGPNSVLIDFTAGPENPAIPFLGRGLREEGGYGNMIVDVAHVPSGSLVSRLTDHHLQIIANRAPIGFEAEFVNRRGINTLYRGILLPFSSDDDTIDFIYGVINWKEMPAETAVAALIAEVGKAFDTAPPAHPVWADGPNAAPVKTGAAILPEAGFIPQIEPDDAGDAPVERSPAATAGWVGTGDAPAFVLPEASFASVYDQEGADDDGDVIEDDACLGDRLAAARDGAALLKASQGRTRAALYRALGLAYDFAQLTLAVPDEYAELLEDSGITPQARAPMTPVVKLIFGTDYDKTRLTEFATALAHGIANDVELGAFRGFLEGHEGGLKGVVAVARATRRPAAKPDQREALRADLRRLPPRAVVDLGELGEEFVLLVARREPDGSAALLTPVADPALLDRALRKIAR